MLTGIDGVVDPRVELPAEQQTMEIEVDLAKARRYGIKPGDVRRAEATLLQGLQVGSIFQGQKVFDVIVQGEPGAYRNMASVRDLLIDRPGGGHVRIGDVADVRVGNTPAVIQRDGVSRRVDIEAGVSGRSLSSVASDVEARLADTKLPLEYHTEVLAQTTNAEIGVTRMLAFGVAALIATFLLLQAAFWSWRLAVLAFLLLPVALVGGVLVGLIGGAELSLGSLLGLLAVFGIAARNGVTQIAHFQDLEHEGAVFGPDLVRAGAADRLAPILTTAVALAVVMLPFLFLGDVAGLEILSPMAAVLLGGLVTSTLVSLFLLPALYLRFGGREPTRSAEDELMYRWAAPEPAAAGAAAPKPHVTGRTTAHDEAAS